MPTPRNVDTHRARGTFRADRHAAAPEAPGEGLGACPVHLTGAAAEVWSELRAECHWLRPVDRLAAEVACRAVASLRAVEAPTPAAVTAAARALAAIGSSPQARGEVTAIPARRPEADPLDEFAPRAAPRLKTAADTDAGR
jgi:hypothetical protein